MIAGGCQGPGGGTDPRRGGLGKFAPGLWRPEPRYSSAGLYPAKRNHNYTLDRPITDEKDQRPTTISTSSAPTNRSGKRRSI